MRLGLAMGGVIALLPAGAHASSFVTIALPSQALSRSFVAPAPATSSFAVLGEPPRPERVRFAAVRPPSPLDAPPHFGGREADVEVSRSMVAMGGPPVVVADASSSARTRRAGLPVVIRGGEIGQAMPAVASSASKFSPTPAGPAKRPEAGASGGSGDEPSAPPRAPGRLPALPAVGRQG